jgi:hypothetical protein
MRAIVIAVLMLAVVNPARALETTRQLLESGAPRLALDRVEQRQPREATDSRWGEWETLRLRALFALKRYQDVLARTGALPAHLPERELREALALAAQSALEAGQPAQARALVARALWQSGAVPDGGRELRLLVIDSYLAEGNGHVAFRAMLRFAQDFHPLEPATAARFVEGLLVLDMAREAANWLARLDEGSAAKQMLRLKAGLVKPDAAIAQSRARLSKGGGRGHWQVIAEAAARGGRRSVRIEALEQLVQNAGGRGDAGAAAAQLWQAYNASAQESANLNHLLVGDDAAWATYASKRLGPDPFIARAFFAYLAQRARSLETRQAAQLQLVRSLQQGKLDAVALRLFDHGSIDATAVDGQARYRLGSIAEAREEATLAAQFWEGLPIPTGMTMAEWGMRRALVNWRAGNVEGAMKALVAATSEKHPLPANAVQGAILLGQEMIVAGKPETADASLPALLLLAGPGYQRELLMALGRTAEASGLFGRAGGYFLQAALAPDGRAPDGTAPKARLAAAFNLARAGYREDARAQFEWVIRHSSDPAEVEAARRGLAKL